MTHPGVKIQDVHVEIHPVIDDRAFQRHFDTLATRAGTIGARIGNDFERQITRTTGALANLNRLYVAEMERAGSVAGNRFGVRFNDSITRSTNTALRNVGQSVNSQMGTLGDTAANRFGVNFGNNIERSTLDSLRRVGATVQREFGELNPEITPIVNTGRAQAAIAGLNERLRSLIGKEIDLTADPSQALAQIELVSARLRSLRDNAATAELRIEATQALAQIEVLKRTMGFDIPATVRVDVDRPLMSRMFGDINREVDRFTQNLTQSLRLLNFSGLTQPYQLFIAAVVASLPFLALLASSLLTASAAATAAIPAFIGFGATFAGIKIAFDGLSEVLGVYVSNQQKVTRGTMTQAEANQKLNETLGRVDQHTRQLAGDLFPLVRGIEAASDAFKSTAFPLFGEALRRMNGLVPIFHNHMKETGTVLGGVAVRLGTLAASPLFQRQFETILSGSRVAMEGFGQATVNLVDAIFTIGAEATPILERFAAWVSSITGRFAAWLEVKRQTGELAAFLQKAADEAAKWGAIVGNFLQGFLNLLIGINPEASKFSDKVLQISEHFKKWTENPENLEKVRAFFGAIAGLDWPRIISTIAAVSGLIAGLRILGAAGGALELMMAFFNPVGATIIGIGLLAAGFLLLYQNSEKFRDEMDPWIQEFEKFLDEELKPTVDKTTQAFKDLATELEKIGIDLGLISDVIGVSVIGGLLNIQGVILAITGQVEQATFWIRSFRQAWEDLGEFFTQNPIGEGIAFGLVLGAIREFVDTVGSIPEAWRRVKEEVEQIVRDLVTSLSGMFSQIGTIFSTALGALPGIASTAWDNVRTTFTSSIETIGTAVRGGAETISTAWRSALEGLQTVSTSVWDNVRRTFRERIDQIGTGLSTATGTMRTIWNTFLVNLGGLTNTNLTSMGANIGSKLTGFRNTINSWTSSVGSLWNSFWTNLRALADRWLTSISNTIRDKLNQARAWPQQFKDFFIDQFNALAVPIARAINAVIGVIDRAIGLVNKILPKSAQIKPLGGVPVPPTAPLPGRAGGGGAFSRLASGGRVMGPGTETSDSIHAKLSKNEYVIRAESAKAIGFHNLAHMNKYGQIPRYATGGAVSPANADGDTGPSGGANIAEARRQVNISRAVLGMGVRPGAGDMGGTPGIIKVYRLLGGTGRVSSAYRPGSRGSSGGYDWHSSGLAVDFAGFNQDAVAKRLIGIGSGILEMIHSTNSGNYGIRMGRLYNFGSGLWNSHKDHVHLAMNHPEINAVLAGRPPGPALPGGSGVEFFDPIGFILSIISPLRGLFNKAMGGFPDGMFGTTAKTAMSGIFDGFASFAAEKVPGGGGGGNVQRWAGLVAQVLTEIGVHSAENVRKVLQSIAQESGGNPNITQSGYVDINTMTGDLAKGLNQVIGATFNRYAGKYRSRGQLDPYANIYASVRYAMARYGARWADVMARPGGYDDGGLIPPGLSMVYNGTTKPEAVFTDSQWKAIRDSKSDQIHEFNFYLDGELINDRVRVEVKNNNKQLVAALKGGRR